MASLDGSSGSVLSADLTIEQLAEERNALQNQNAQLWKLVDKQRNMIVGLQKDLDAAKKNLHTGQASDGPSATLPYPTTPKKGEAGQRMPGITHIVEDYDDVSSATDQSPDLAKSPIHTLSRTRSSSISHKVSRPAHPTEHEGGPPIKSPLRATMNYRGNTKDDKHETTNRSDGSSSPMSPALSMRLQQVQRVVSPLTQTFPQSVHSLDEVERVHVPRRERVRTSSSAKSTATLQGLDQKAVSAARVVRHDLRGQSTSAQGDPHDVSGASIARLDKSSTLLSNSTSIDSDLYPPMQTPEEGVPGAKVATPFNPFTQSKMTLSNSESGNTLADITRPYYSDSSSFLPLGKYNDAERGAATPERAGSPATTRMQEQSADSDYSDFGEPENESKASSHSRQPAMALEPAVEFLPTPVKHVWDEYSPERRRRDSELSNRASPTPASPSLRSSVQETLADSKGLISALDLHTIRVCMIDNGANPFVDIGVFRPDMILIHILRKTYSDLLSLQDAMPVRPNNDLPARDEFESFAPGKITTRRAAVDLWFQALQEQLVVEGNPQASVLFSAFLSTNQLETHLEQVVPVSVTSGSTKGRSDSFTSTQYKDIPSEQSFLVKEGFLKKRGKNFGGWKSRYFVLNGPILHYYESQGGSLLGTIKLVAAQIARHQTHAETNNNEKEYDSLQYAFLIMEPKKRNTTSFVRHLLCANSDADCDEWIKSLNTYVRWGESSADTKEPSSVESKTRRESSKDSRKSIRNLSISTPIRGSTSEQSESTLQNNRLEQFAAIGYSDTFPGRQPAFDSQDRVPGSPPVHRDQELPSVSISRPMNGAPIDNHTAWGATALTSPSMLQTSAASGAPDKKVKKKSFWTFGKSGDNSTSTTQRDLAAMQTASMNDLAYGTQARTAHTTGVFGVSLAAAVLSAKELGFHTLVPVVVSRCIDYLDLKHAEQEEGIYRLSGSNTVIRNLKERFNKEIDINLAGSDEYFDIHAIAGLLKLYLRELPSSILTQELQRDFLDIIEVPEGLARTITVRTLVQSLPRENFELLKLLSRHLGTIVSNSDLNKMTLRNVGIVFSPTLNIPAAVFSLFIAEYETLFEDREAEVSRNLSPRTFTDAASLRSLHSNNPTASVVLDTEQSYHLFHQDQLAETSGNPYGIPEYGSRTGYPTADSTNTRATTLSSAEQAQYTYAGEFL